MIVTVDGPAGSGKSTVSRALSRRLRLPYLNSGFIYRAVTLLVLEGGGRFDDPDFVAAKVAAMELRFSDAGERTEVFLGDGSGSGEREVSRRLRDPDVTSEIYRIANNGYYRSLLVDIQRRCAEPDGVVAEGRDMGTVIFPAAEHKFFLEASAEERARRRHADLVAAGHPESFEDVLASVIERDRHDREREHAPLRVPAGAHVVDTDPLTAEEVVDRLVALVSPARADGAGAT